jgi:hypothetical protein
MTTDWEVVVGLTLLAVTLSLLAAVVGAALIFF